MNNAFDYKTSFRKSTMIVENNEIGLLLLDFEAILLGFSIAIYFFPHYRFGMTPVFAFAVQSLDS